MQCHCPKRRWSNLRETSEGRERDQSEVWRLILCPWHSLYRKAAKSSFRHAAFFLVAFWLYLDGEWKAAHKINNVCEIKCHNSILLTWWFLLQCIFHWKHPFHPISDTPACFPLYPLSRPTLESGLFMTSCPLQQLWVLLYAAADKSTTSSSSTSFFCSATDCAIFWGTDCFCKHHTCCLTLIKINSNVVII